MKWNSKKRDAFKNILQTFYKLFRNISETVVTFRNIKCTSILMRKKYNLK